MPSLLHLCLNWQHTSQTCVCWPFVLQECTHDQHDHAEEVLFWQQSDRSVLHRKSAALLQISYPTKSKTLGLFSSLHPEDEQHHLQCTCQVVDRSSLRVNNWCKSFGEDTTG